MWKRQWHPLQNRRQDSWLWEWSLKHWGTFGKKFGNKKGNRELTIRNKCSAPWLCHQKWRFSSNPKRKIIDDPSLYRQSQCPENAFPFSYGMALLHFYTEDHSLFLKTSPHFFCHSLLSLLFHWPALPPFSSQSFPQSLPIPRSPHPRTPFSELLNFSTFTHYH